MSDDTRHIPAAAADLLISQPDDPTTAVVDLAAAAGGDRRGRIRARGMRELSWTMDAPCVRPLPAKAGFGCSCFDDRAAHAFASDKRGGLWACAGVSVVASCAHRQIRCLRPFVASRCQEAGVHDAIMYADYDSRLGVG